MFHKSILRKAFLATRRLSLILLTALALNFVVAASAHAAEYYIAPSGNDSNAGTSAAPWRTFGHAIPRLNPGDTLVLKDGMYTQSTTGLLSIRCNAGAKNASLANPITVRAENERQAFIKGDGESNTVEVSRCKGWVIHGLHAESADNPNSFNGVVIAIKNSEDIILRRNLAAKPNAYANAQGISVIGYPRPNTSRNILIEENELYDFHRNGIECFPETVTRCIIRRNYIANRKYRRPSESKRWGPNDGFVMYFNQDSIIENNIAEMRGESGFANPGNNNSFYGNISISTNGEGVALVTNRHPSYGPYNNAGLWVDNVAIGATAGMTTISVSNIKYVNNTAIDNSSTGFHGNNKYDKRVRPVKDWSVNPNVTMINGLSVNNNTYGFIFTHTEMYSGLTLDHLNSYGHSNNYGPGTGGRTNSISVDPQLGSCKVFIPEGSPMKGAGANGDDIGANVLCRYENGVLTQQQLWNWQTGQFPCGAIVAGVNDKPGQSCFDVHKRLNVNYGGCQLPANPSCKQPAGGTFPGIPDGVPPAIPRPPSTYDPTKSLCPI